MSGTGLKLCREQLNQGLTSTPAEQIPAEWNSSIRRLISQWWSAYKRWEAQDTFAKAYEESRMTVRSFGKDFGKEVHKNIPRGTLKVTEERFFANRQRAALDPTDHSQHYAAFHEEAESQKYWQNRGLDSAAFADPANFISREVKYAHGLHDLSASLVNPRKPLNLQLFSSGDGVHLAFAPLSKEEDQQVIWRLAGLAKRLQAQLPEFYSLIHGYRARMTRIKLARNYDIGTGFIATPAANPGQGPQYKLTYGLGTTIKEKGKFAPRPIDPQEQQRLQTSMRQQALQFKQILAGAVLNKGEVNEIVIALREHDGPFPVYAVLRKDQGLCECFDIAGGQRVMNGHTISIQDGTMT